MADTDRYKVTRDAAGWVVIDKLDGDKVVWGPQAGLAGYLRADAHCRLLNRRLLNR